MTLNSFVVVFAVIGLFLLALGVVSRAARKSRAAVTVRLKCPSCGHEFKAGARKETEARSAVRGLHRKSGCSSTMYTITRPQ